MESIASNSILLADDNQTFLMYIGILIRRLGYQIFLARDGLEALKIAKEKKPTTGLYYAKTGWFIMSEHDP
jgi:CheY-like chemotaxis protein